MKLIALSALVLILAACGDTPAADPAEPGVVDAPAVEGAPEVEPTTAPAAEAEWVEVFRVEGDGIKDTETFTIAANEWRVSWDTKPGEFGDMNFAVTIMDAAGGMVALAANVMGANADSTIQRGAGDYYLSILSGQPYTIIVEEKR